MPKTKNIETARNIYQGEKGILSIFAYFYKPSDYLK